MKRLLLILPLLVLLLGRLPSASAGAVWYVATTGNNTTGNSPTNAWTELGAINWSQIAAGDTIQVSSGTYHSSLVIGRSGVTVRAVGGRVTILGGRTTPLPECDQQTYIDQSASARAYGLDFAGQSNVVVDGQAWSGFTISGHNRDGVRMSGTANRLSYVEVFDNGQVTRPATGYRSDQPGILISGTGHSFDHDLIHDNGQDAFQGSGALGNITISDSWLYNARAHSSNSSLAFNFCMHSDGFQVYTGGPGVQSGITLRHSILGPGLMQGTILGQTGTPGAVVNDVSLTDVLILDTTNANVMGYPSIKETGWIMNRVTSFHTAYDPDAGSHWALFLEGAGNQATNSIWYGGGSYTPDGLVTSGNIQFNMASGVNLGPVQDPQFAAAPAYNSQPSLAALIAGDYASTSGKGSSLTSVNMLLGTPPVATATPASASATSAPSATRTATHTPTARPTATSTDTAVPTGTAAATQTQVATATATATPTATAAMPAGCALIGVEPDGESVWVCK